jgi:hypothetical protein
MATGSRTSSRRTSKENDGDHLAEWWQRNAFSCRQFATPTRPWRWGAAIADMNRDGKADLVVAADVAIRVFVGDGAAASSPLPARRIQPGKGPGDWSSPISTATASSMSPRGAWKPISLRSCTGIDNEKLRSHATIRSPRERVRHLKGDRL